MTHYMYVKVSASKDQLEIFHKKDFKMKLVPTKLLKVWGSLQLICKFATSFQGNRAFGNTSADCQPEQADSQEHAPWLYKTSRMLEPEYCPALHEKWFMRLFPLSHLT